MKTATNIDDVIAILDDVIAGYRDKKSALAFFPTMYRAVTVRVRDGIGQGTFADGLRMNRFDTVFANRYFEALDAWQKGQETPRCWRTAFLTAERGEAMILQHLLLGMNAHINLDLPIAALDTAPGPSLPELEGDFMKINDILAAALDPLQGVVDRFSPLFDVIDRVGGKSDEALASFSIRVARDEAWHEATRLAGEPDAMRVRSIKSLDRRVTLLAEHIIAPSGPLGLAASLVARTESRDVAAIVDAMLAVP